MPSAFARARPTTARSKEPLPGFLGCPGACRHQACRLRRCGTRATAAAHAPHLEASPGAKRVREGPNAGRFGARAADGRAGQGAVPRCSRARAAHAVDVDAGVFHGVDHGVHDVDRRVLRLQRHTRYASGDLRRACRHSRRGLHLPADDLAAIAGADRRVTHRGHEILRYGDVRVFSDHGDDVDLVGSSATATVWPMPGSPPVWGPSISPAPSCMKYSVIALFISDLCIGSGIAQPKGAIARCRRRGQPDRVEHGERADNG